MGNTALPSHLNNIQDKREIFLGMGFEQNNIAKVLSMTKNFDKALELLLIEYMSGRGQPDILHLNQVDKIPIPSEVG